MKKTAQKYDAIILGSGIAGLGAAYAFVKRGKKVLILSPKTPRKGESTPASAGILDPFLESASPKNSFFNLKLKAFLKLPRQFRQIEREAGLKIGYARTGMLFTALNSAEEKALKLRLSSHRPAGVPVTWIDRNQALRKWPYLNREILGVLFYPTLGRVIPQQLQGALRRIVSCRGAKMTGIRGKVRLLLEKGRISGVVMNGKKVLAPNVINACGSWADQARFSTLSHPVFPVRGQILIIHGNADKVKTVVHSAGGTYVVPWEQGTYLLGSTVEKVGFKPRVQTASLQRIHREAALMIPGLKAARAVKNWAGLRPCSKDHLPLLGKTSINGYYVATGYYRSGIVISLYAGELLAEGIFGTHFPKELAPFRPLRFQKRR